jgi:Cu/Ag efflux protein CusF
VIQHIRVSLVAAGLAGLVACATETPVPEPSVSTSERQSPGSAERQNIVKVSAAVEEIDHSSRDVTLRRADGSKLSFRVDDSVRNLEQVKKGDIVEATYYESLAVNLRKPGEATPGSSAVSASGRPESGGRADAGSVTIVATIRALDPAKGTATLEDEHGNLTTINVRNPDHFDVARVGDLVEITYTEAIAISVEKPAR